MAVTYRAVPRPARREHGARRARAAQCLQPAAAPVVADLACLRPARRARKRVREKSRAGHAASSKTSTSREAIREAHYTTALTSAFKGQDTFYPSRSSREFPGGDVAAQGRRRYRWTWLTCSDAPVGYSISGVRPGLVPVLQRASARSRPPSGAREFPTVVPPPALYNGLRSLLALISLLNVQRSGAVLRRLQRDRCRLDLARDGPAEGSNFPCNRSDDHGVALRLRDQLSTFSPSPCQRR